MATTTQPARKSYLEGLVSKTDKFKVEELLDLYAVYDHLVIDHVFCKLLYPYCKVARSWVLDQARDLIAGTDRNRLILTSRARKASEEKYSRSGGIVKPKNQDFVMQAILLSRKALMGDVAITPEDVKRLGLSRMVCDDVGLFVLALLRPYPELVTRYLQAKADGDSDLIVSLDAEMTAIEAEVGVHRDHAWYVAVNLRAIYDSLQRQVQHVCLAYTRLLFRFAHQLRGMTETDENFSAGYQGLVNAARNYDPSDGSSFTSHCAWWIKSAILTRQRQSSVIQVPTTTRNALTWAETHKDEVSGSRLSDLRGRADLYFTAARNRRDEDSDEVISYDATIISSPEAEVVLGSSVQHAQRAEEGYHEDTAHTNIRVALSDVFDMLSCTDPASLFPFLLWALNAGIDASLLAQASSRMFCARGHKAA